MPQKQIKLFCLKLDRVAPVLTDTPSTSSNTLPLCAGVCCYQGGEGGVTEWAEVEAVVKDLVQDLVGNMVGAKFALHFFHFTQGDV